MRFHHQRREVTDDLDHPAASVTDPVNETIKSHHTGELEMNSYSEIHDWISSTIRNDFFFKQAENAQKIAMEIRNFRLSRQFLSERIANPMTRDEYLEWVRAWRAIYSKISIESRISKQNRKGGDAKGSMNIGNVYSLRIQASSLMDLRTASKEVARAAYAARKSQKVSEAA